VAGLLGGARAHLTGSSELAEFACPRCARAVTERYYGPCEPCRDELAVAFSPAARHVEATRFEPRMHVTPNAVATKD
jgi:hypothetical protein